MLVFWESDEEGTPPADVLRNVCPFLHSAEARKRNMPSCGTASQHGPRFSVQPFDLSCVFFPEVREDLNMRLKFELTDKELQKRCHEVLEVMRLQFRRAPTWTDIKIAFHAFSVNVVITIRNKNIQMQCLMKEWSAQEATLGDFVRFIEDAVIEDGDLLSRLRNVV
jgi:hypothetical protein